MCRKDEPCSWNARRAKMVIKILLWLYILGVIVLWLGAIDFFVYGMRYYYDKNDESREITLIYLIVALIFLILKSLTPVLNFCVGARLSLEKDDLWEERS
jgi:uncharacterized membrane protein